MSEVFNQPARKSLHLISEVKGVSMDNVTLSGGSFVSAEVLGQDADGKFIKLNLDDAAAGGTAKGVLFGAVDASVADAPGLAHTRVCAVRADKLVWPEGITDERKAALIDDLVAAHIIPRS
ncbi:MAG: head decoration protein [Shewanella sp.]|nr:head decoration protein [Shewanella sp.]